MLYRIIKNRKRYKSVVIAIKFSSMYKELIIEMRLPARTISAGIQRGIFRFPLVRRYAIKNRIKIPLIQSKRVIFAMNCKRMTGTKQAMSKKYEFFINFNLFDSSRQ